jgi:hypothetical protein
MGAAAKQWLPVERRKVIGKTCFVRAVRSPSSGC